MEKTIKKTKKDLFKELKEIVVDNTELTAFIDHEIELLEKKNSKSSETKTQKDNKILKDIIVEILSQTEKALSITEIQKAHEKLEDLSNQKISALLKQLVDSNIVERVQDKKKTLFKLV